MAKKKVISKLIPDKKNTQQRKEAKIITLYNNKGGVSKTTTLYNLAAMLAKDGRKVLLADCDPQCNATELFFASNPAIDDPGKELPGTSIYQALLPRLSGEVNKVNAKGVKLSQNNYYKNLYLLRGDFEFSLAEGYLATSTVQAITENIHEKNNYLAIYRLLTDLGKEHSFDYILCDVGPSTGAITRQVFLACNGFFLPLTPDRFSNQAVEVLSKVTQDWSKKHQEIMKTFEPYKLETFPGKPQFLGAVMQNFKIHSAAKAKASYLKWQERIKKNITQQLTQDLPKKSTLKKDPFIASIRDVGQLAPVAQMFGCAIFDIKREYTAEASTTGKSYGGVIWKDWQDRMKEYKNEIEHIARAIE